MGKFYVSLMDEYWSAYENISTKIAISRRSDISSSERGKMEQERWDMWVIPCLLLLIFIRYGKYSDHAAMVVKTFGSTLRRGSKFLYQALPRLLTLWLDYSYPKPEFEEKK